MTTASHQHVKNVLKPETSWFHFFSFFFFLVFSKYSTIFLWRTHCEVTKGNWWNISSMLATPASAKCWFSSLRPPVCWHSVLIVAFTVLLFYIPTVMCGNVIYQISLLSKGFPKLEKSQSIACLKFGTTFIEVECSRHYFNIPTTSRQTIISLLGHPLVIGVIQWPKSW